MQLHDPPWLPLVITKEEQGWTGELPAKSSGIPGSARAQLYEAAIPYRNLCDPSLEALVAREQMDAELNPVRLTMKYVTSDQENR